MLKNVLNWKKKASAHNLDISRMVSHKTERQQIQHTEIIASGNETSNALKEIRLFLQQHNQRGLEKFILWENIFNWRPKHVRNNC